MEDINSNAEFEQLIFGSKPVVLDFYAEWCGPCQVLLPILESISETNNDVVVAKINVDDHQGLAAQFKVKSIPSLFFIKDKMIVDQSVGLLTKEQVEEKIQQLIASKPINRIH